MTCSQHIECHEQKSTQHIYTWIFQHALKCILLPNGEIFCGILNVGCGRPATLAPDSYYKIEYSELFSTDIFPSRILKTKKFQDVTFIEQIKETAGLGEPVIQDNKDIGNDAVEIKLTTSKYV